jgi:hypothetical protein
MFNLPPITISQPSLISHSMQMGSPNINLSKLQGILQNLQPLTLPYKDKEGRTIQIWKYNSKFLIGAVLDKKGHLTGKNQSE